MRGNPGCPLVDLRSALEKAMLIRAALAAQVVEEVDTPALVRMMGYARAHGTFYDMKKALKDYGLLGQDGPRGGYRLTPLALTIMEQPVGSPERLEAVRQAAQAPAVFARLLSEMAVSRTTPLPADEEILAALRAHGANPSTRDQALHAYRETLFYLFQEEEGSADPLSPLGAPSSSRVRPVRKRDLPLVAPPDLVIPIARDGEAEVRFTSTPTQAGFSLLLEHLRMELPAYPVAYGGDEPPHGSDRGDGEAECLSAVSTSNRAQPGGTTARPQEEHLGEVASLLLSVAPRTVLVRRLSQHCRVQVGFPAAHEIGAEEIDRLVAYLRLTAEAYPHEEGEASGEGDDALEPLFFRLSPSCWCSLVFRGHVWQQDVLRLIDALALVQQIYA